MPHTFRAVNGVHTQAGAVEAARAIRDAGGVAEAFEADVTDGQQVAELVVAVADRLGPVDVLVLNATGPQPEAPVAEVAWSDHLDQLDCFVKRPVLLGRAVLPAMRQSAGFRTGQRLVVDGGRGLVG